MRYYKITVFEDKDNIQEIPIIDYVAPHNLDNNQIIELALKTGNIEEKDIQFINDISTQTEAEHKELLAQNHAKFTIKTINESRDFVDDQFVLINQELEKLQLGVEEFIEKQLQKHYDKYSKFKVGDIIRAKTHNAHIKIDRISASVCFGNELNIIYHGKRYKKADKGFVRTKDKKEHSMNENHVFLVE